MTTTTKPQYRMAVVVDRSRAAYGTAPTSIVETFPSGGVRRTVATLDAAAVGTGRKVRCVAETFAASADLLALVKRLREVHTQNNAGPEAERQFRQIAIDAAPLLERLAEFEAAAAF